ncbi:helix-turn-helix domain-containing protein [Herbaspirillum huttiense]|uniref:helix-turn-helix domain-containing protein n=1 Tax=Herbaspirillum huttiense TaxID=863372 RepID=UPI0006864DC3|nr:helix-turn-helix transcriptional regulator [Herbaspirillum huttiense]
MNNSSNLPAEQAKRSDEDMFSNLPPLDGWQIKSEVIAANLAALIYHCGKSRAAIAEELGMHKSAVTRLLSGKNNTKLKTIWEITSHLGFDFDVVFHNASVPPPLQPWDHESPLEAESHYVQILTNDFVPAKFFDLQVQTQDEVVRDHVNGIGRERLYISEPKSIPLTPMASLSYNVDTKPSLGISKLEMIDFYKYIPIESEKNHE